MEYLHPKLKVTNIDCLGEWDQDRIRFALEGNNRIFSDPAFKEDWLKADLRETKINGEGRSLSNQEVWDTLCKADQLAVGDDLGVLDFKVVMYRKSFSKVVGYTFVDSLTIWVNYRFFGHPKYIGSNLFHEGTHQLGFLHESLWAYSVPYNANRIYEKHWDRLCKDIDDRYWKWYWS